MEYYNLEYLPKTDFGFLNNNDNTYRKYIASLFDKKDDYSDINTRTEIIQQPATTNQLSNPTVQKLPDQCALNYAETRLATGCFPQPAEL